METLRHSFPLERGDAARSAPGSPLDRRRVSAGLHAPYAAESNDDSVCLPFCPAATDQQVYGSDARPFTHYSRHVCVPLTPLQAMEEPSFIHVPVSLSTATRPNRGSGPSVQHLERQLHRLSTTRTAVLMKIGGGSVAGAAGGGGSGSGGNSGGDTDSAGHSHDGTGNNTGSGTQPQPRGRALKLFDRANSVGRHPRSGVGVSRFRSSANNVPIGGAERAAGEGGGGLRALRRAGGAGPSTSSDGVLLRGSPGRGVERRTPRSRVSALMMGSNVDVARGIAAVSRAFRSHGGTGNGSREDTGVSSVTPTHGSEAHQVRVRQAAALDAGQGQDGSRGSGRPVAAPSSAQRLYQQHQQQLLQLQQQQQQLQRPSQSVGGRRPRSDLHHTGKHWHITHQQHQHAHDYHHQQHQQQLDQPDQQQQAQGLQHYDAVWDIQGLYDSGSGGGSPPHSPWTPPATGALDPPSDLPSFRIHPPPTFGQPDHRRRSFQVPGTGLSDMDVEEVTAAMETVEAAADLGGAHAASQTPFTAAAAMDIPLADSPSSLGSGRSPMGLRSTHQVLPHGHGASHGSPTAVQVVARHSVGGQRASRRSVLGRGVSPSELSSVLADLLGTMYAPRSSGSGGGGGGGRGSSSGVGHTGVRHSSHPAAASAGFAQQQQQHYPDPYAGSQRHSASRLGPAGGGAGAGAAGAAGPSMGPGWSAFGSRPASSFIPHTTPALQASASLGRQPDQLDPSPSFGSPPALGLAMMHSGSLDRPAAAATAAAVTAYSCPGSAFSSPCAPQVPPLLASPILGRQPSLQASPVLGRAIALLASPTLAPPPAAASGASGASSTGKWADSRTPRRGSQTSPQLQPHALPQQPQQQQQPIPLRPGAILARAAVAPWLQPPDILDVGPASDSNLWLLSQRRSEVTLGTPLSPPSPMAPTPGFLSPQARGPLQQSSAPGLPALADAALSEGAEEGAEQDLSVSK